MATHRVALAGNPNAGKTTVFNALCGARQKTGNYAGVTVERKFGNLRQNPDIEILDLPGTYSLKAKSADEAITTEVLLGTAAGEKKPDLVLAVIDASNLKRSLYLVQQLQELNLPIVGALTMTDIAARRGISLDVKELQKQLGFPLCEVTMATAEQVTELARLLETPPAFKAAKSKKTEPTIEERYSAIDTMVRKAVKQNARPKNSVTSHIDAVLTHRVFGLAAFALIIGGVFFSIYAGARPVMDAIDAGMKAVGAFLGGKLEAYPVTASLVSDGVIAGAGSVFVFLPQIMILFFFISVLEETGYLARAAFLMDKLLGWTGLNGRAFIPLLSSFACAIPGILSARVMPTDRARMATILIAPLMSCSARLPVYVLFIGAFIEPRAGALWAAAALFGMHLVGISVAMPLAWLLNRKILKTGQSPFVLELPEYRKPHFPNVFRRVYDAATDFLKRVGTIIFALSIVIWALAYFPHKQATYDSGISAFAKSADVDKTAIEALLKKNNLNEAEIAQKLEVENTLRAAYLRDSFLGSFGRTVEPVFRPLGFDWKISVAILAAFPAREVFVSTLGIIFSVTDAKDDPAALGKKLAAEKKADGKPAYDMLLALSIMIFFALCAQCMSTLATIRRELGSTGWAVGVFFAMTSLAYVISLAVYQIGKKLA